MGIGVCVSLHLALVVWPLLCTLILFVKLIWIVSWTLSVSQMTICVLAKSEREIRSLFALCRPSSHSHPGSSSVHCSSGISAVPTDLVLLCESGVTITAWL